MRGTSRACSVCIYLMEPPLKKAVRKLAQEDQEGWFVQATMATDD
jgi:hypothetical protein